MRKPDPERYSAWALEATIAASSVANYCDHVEHNERVDRDWIWTSAHTLRAIACEIADHEELDLRSLYATRLRMIEQRNPLFEEEGFDGGARAETATTWRDLQLAQSEHDRNYHPDVVGLSKLDQLHHYSLHLTKLAGALAEVARGADVQDFLDRRLPDMLLFGIKLSTVTGKALPAKGLEAASVGDQGHLIAA